MTEDRPSPASPEADDALYRDPFAGRGACALALAIEPGRRRLVTQHCPRCGSAKGEAEAPGDASCLLDRVELDQLALDRDAAEDPPRRDK
ncbi:MAG: hypothetical protein MI920_05200 [Kiloniellales bacterium]|nr:hypothetical protein [Kiloniellales bacterium]